MCLSKLIFYGILDLTIDFYLFYFYEWYSKYNIVTRDSLTLCILLSCRISISFSQNFFVTLGCFSGCKLYCVTLGCVNSSSWSLPFVRRAGTRTWHAASLLKFCFENWIPTGRLPHCSCEMLVTHISWCPPPPKVFGRGRAPSVFVQCLPQWSLSPIS